MVRVCDGQGQGNGPALFCAEGVAVRSEMPAVGPLTGLRVLDLSMLMPGPLCTMLLADWGAEVIKVEPRLGGDALRYAGDPVRKDSAYYLGLNRNKRSLAVDVRKPEGREVVLRLAATAGVFLEGFRAGKAERLRLGYADLKAASPGLVYCSLSGYGQEGPWSGRGGHDLGFQALAGMLQVMGGPDGRPQMPGLPLADIAGAFMAAAAILAGLWERERTGEGRFLDVTLHESTLYWLAPLVTATSVGVEVRPGEMGLTGGWPCYGLYETSDGRYMALAAMEPHFWSEFCRLVGHEEWLPHGRVGGAEGERVRREVAELFRTRTQAEWTQLLQEADLCLEPVLSLSEALAHPQVRQRGLAEEVASSTEGRLGQVGVPVRSERPMGAVRLPPPRLGEHTEELLRELGCPPEEIDRLVAGRVIGV